MSNFDCKIEMVRKRIQVGRQIPETIWSERWAKLKERRPKAIGRRENFKSFQKLVGLPLAIEQLFVMGDRSWELEAKLKSVIRLAGPFFKNFDRGQRVECAVALDRVENT